MAIATAPLPATQLTYFGDEIEAPKARWQLILEQEEAPPDWLQGSARTLFPLSVLSFGAGQDRTALLYLLTTDLAFRARYAPGRLLVLCSDTGDEHQPTIDHIEATKAYVSGLRPPYEAEFVHITHDMGLHGGAWSNGLIGYYRATNTVGSVGLFRTCTHRLC